MPSVHDSPESVPTINYANAELLEQSGKRHFKASSVLHLPLNVYLLLFFTLGKGFQLTIATLNVNYYAHSLGYRPDFIGLLSAMPAIGSLFSAVPSGFLADRLGLSLIHI